MEIRLQRIALDEYAREVLPHSARLWAGGRSLQRYAGDLHDFAASSYGRRRFQLIGIREDGNIVTSCKRYERELRCGERTLRTIGIGAVFTQERFRGRGLATALIASLLDAEHQAGTDLAFLFSDIRPHFYEELGFVTLPSRRFTLRARSLPFERIKPASLSDADWSGVARCFAALDDCRTIAPRRTPVVWELMRSRFRITPRAGNRLNLVIRSGRRILAYCLGQRDVDADAYVVEEFSFAGERYAHLIAPLLRAAAGDLRKITGWLPPEPAREALPAAIVRARRSTILMATPLSTFARSRWRSEATNIARASGDLVWSTDHV